MIERLDRTDTKSRILDAAENLFWPSRLRCDFPARHNRRSLRVNLAAVNYHLQSKDSLIDAVIQRRIEPMNTKRLEMLDAAGPNASIEQIVEKPSRRRMIETDLTPIVPLLGRILSTPDQFVHRVFKKHLSVVAQRFTEAIAAAFPDLTPAERMWRMHFMGGAMAHVLSWSHLLPELTEGVCDPSDRKAVTARLVRFVAAGFRAGEGN